MPKKHDHYYKKVDGKCRCGKDKSEHRHGAGRPETTGNSHLTREQQGEKREREQTPTPTADPDRGQEEFIIQEPEPIEEDSQHVAYQCDNCDGEIYQGDMYCKTCVSKLNWEGV